MSDAIEADIRQRIEDTRQHYCDGLITYHEAERKIAELKAKLKVTK